MEEKKDEAKELSNRLDKGSIDKGRGGEEEESPSPPNSKTYGEFQNVNLSDEEYQRLKEKLKSHTNTMIEKLSRYMQSSGKTYQDHIHHGKMER